jgi:hypothetical protein
MVESQGTPLEFGPGEGEKVGPQNWQVSYRAKNLSAYLEVEFSKEFRWISWQVHLRADRGPVEITRIYPLWLLLPRPVHHGIPCFLGISS